ncbi:hypothetical protein BASA81_001937 [Batrachochytrium salamandrivorans]|nr:hypothetical protein BASA81_001937 [Batrachochytrium salamandrivorans]
MLAASSVLPPPSPTAAAIPPTTIMPRPTVVLDYDNTLLATSWLQRWSHAETPSPFELAGIRDEMHNLDQHVYAFLSHVLEIGRVVVMITNARLGWVEHSCAKIMPRVCALLPRIKVISARSRYERTFPGQPEMWKLHAFREELCGMGHHPLNVISIGDSWFERDAAHVVGGEHSNATVKSIQLVDCPHPKDICAQLSTLRLCMLDIAQHDSHLDLKMSRRL